MPRLRIIILEKKGRDLKFAFWADVPAARQPHYANPNAKSAWIGATAQDNANLVSGAVVERATNMRVPAGSTFQQVQNILQNNWQTFQTSINDTNDWQRYGSTWDGTTWTVADNP